LASTLKDEYGILYTGQTGRVAHEMILDTRHFKKEYGVETADLARRLMDYGFHAPTVSFPVHETLMIEPTESESKGEMDRFVEALVAIKRECEAIREGQADAADNVVSMAPHTAFEATGDGWTHPYPRHKAVYPLAWVADKKFWPAVSRIDSGYGDRNLICRATGEEYE
jgi:glycine dehydrogenase